MKSTTGTPRPPRSVEQAIAESVYDVLAEHMAGEVLHNIETGAKSWSCDLSDLCEYFRGSLSRGEVKTALNILANAGLVTFLASDMGLCVVLPNETPAADGDA